MFATADLAARIDRAEGRLCAGLAERTAAREPAVKPFTMPVAGGIAVFAGPGSPTNKMIGIGFERAPDEAELAEVEARFSAAGAALQAEVSTLASPDTLALFVRRGYEPRGFENELGHPLEEREAVLAEGVTIVRLPAATPEFCDIMVEGFTHQDVGGVGGDALPGAEAARQAMMLMAEDPGFRAYQAYLDGQPVGVAGLRIDQTIAQFCGAATLLAFRRRGVQTSLVRARLADAAVAGCEVAVVTVQPASKSQQNTQRAGFALLYSRALLVKTP